MARCRSQGGALSARRRPHGADSRVFERPDGHSGSPSWRNGEHPPADETSPRLTAAHGSWPTATCANHRHPYRHAVANERINPQIGSSATSSTSPRSLQTTVVPYSRGLPRRRMVGSAYGLFGRAPGSSHLPTVPPRNAPRTRWSRFAMAQDHVVLGQGHRALPSGFTKSSLRHGCENEGTSRAVQQAPLTYGPACDCDRGLRGHLVPIRSCGDSLGCPQAEPVGTW